MVTVRAMQRSLCRLAKRASARIWFTKNHAIKTQQTRAVFDGGSEGRMSRVLGWAESLERLLEDPLGLHFFTEFLVSEVSSENIIFYQACEKFSKIPHSSLRQLKTEAAAIYEKFLCASSPLAVNIDHMAQLCEVDLLTPHPDMFQQTQTQVLKLMKMDSYRRFVGSPLYQSCLKTCVEGKTLLHKQSVERMVWASDSSKRKVKKRGSWEAHLHLTREKVAELRESSRPDEHQSWGPRGVEASSSESHLETSVRSRQQQQQSEHLVEMLFHAQCRRVDNQRGLLTPEQLELPDFLHLDL